MSSTDITGRLQHSLLWPSTCVSEADYSPSLELRTSPSDSGQTLRPGLEGLGASPRRRREGLGQGEEGE